MKKFLFDLFPLILFFLAYKFADIYVATSVAIIAGILGFAGIAGTAAWIAKVLFLVFLVLFVVSLISGRRPAT